MSPRLTARFTTPEAAANAARELHLAGFDRGQVHVSQDDEGPLASLIPRDDRERPAQVDVDAGDRMMEAAAILYRYGGRSEGTPARTDATAAPTGGETLELIAEELIPQVTPVPIGEVVVRKRVVVETRMVEVEVRREEVVVERLPFESRELADDEGGLDDRMDAEGGAHPLGADEEIVRIPVYEERVIITKEPRVAGHVVVRKRRVTEVRQISEPVRREVPVVSKRGRARVENRTAAAR